MSGGSRPDVCLKMKEIDMIEKEQLQGRFELFLEKVRDLGGDSRELIFERPATEQEVEDIESQLDYILPGDFRNALLTISSHCEFRWFLPDDFELPDVLQGIFCGDMHWGLDYIIPFNEKKDGWISNVFADPDDEYDAVWCNKFAFYSVGNGDMIAIDLAEDSYGEIVYLSHDDGEGHGYVMANSFTELLNNWSQIGCVGGEDWQWISFVDDEADGINPIGENALLWRRLIGFV
jgi:hypothetical protein